MPETALKIGEVARRAGVRVQTLHFYERTGLLPKPRRSSTDYRLYSRDAIDRVAFIKKAQQLGLTLEEIKDILGLKDHGVPPCRRVAELGERRLLALDAEIAKLRKFRSTLAAALPKWQKETVEERACAGQFCDLNEGLPVCPSLRGARKAAKGTR